MAVGSTELKVTLVGGHVFLAEVQEGSDPRTRAKDILTYGTSSGPASTSSATARSSQSSIARYR